MKINIKKKAQKFISKQDKKQQLRLYKAIYNLPNGDIKQLKGYKEKGYGVIFVEDYPLSFYKESNHQIKNLFPKGLRR